jgi:hypothetical protein
LKMMQRHGYRSYRETRKLYLETTLDLRHMPTKETRRLIRKMPDRRSSLEIVPRVSQTILAACGDRTKIQLGDSDFVIPNIITEAWWTCDIVHFQLSKR